MTMSAVSASTVRNAVLLVRRRGGDEIVSEAPALALYLIANLAVANGARAPAPDANTPIPSSLDIDYMRVWKR